MNVQEIFDLPAIKEVERNVLDLQRDIETGHGNDDNNVAIIKQLLLVRKHLLDREFVMDETYKSLLGEFNDALRQQLIAMRNNAIKAYNAVTLTDVDGDAEVTGECYLGYGYSKIHPVQTIRAKKMWCMLNETLDHYNRNYENGVCDGWRYPRGDGYTDSENYLLYLNDEVDNWDDWFFGNKMTADMHLIHPVNQLLESTYFSIFDLLWVRDFSIEVTVETDYDTYKDEEQGDDLDWSKYDYKD